MLKVFRDNLKYLSWVLWLVIIVFVLFLFTDFGSIAPGGGLDSTAAVRVGDYEISYADFERAYRQQEQRFEQAYGDRLDPETARQLGLYNQVLEILVTQKILEAEGERMGIEISDEEVREAILEYPVFKDDKGNFVGQERYLSILRNARLSPDAFEASMRQDMLINRVRALLNENVYVSEAEVEKSYRDSAERAKIRFIRLAASDFAGKVTLDDAEVADYFEQHRAEFEVPEKRVADYLLIDWAQLRSTVEVTDAEIAGYYSEHEDDYRREEQVQARHILVRTGNDRTTEEAISRIEEARARIERGEDFAAVAAEVSDDPGSKDRGGDLGSFGRGQMVPAFEEAAFSANVGDLVGPVETSFGVHLIQVLGRSEGGLQPLEEVSTSINNRIAAERAQTLAETTAQELAKRIKREKIDTPEALSALAEQENGVLYLTTDPFARDEPIAGIGRSPAFANAAFEAAPGEFSEPIKIPRGWVLLRVAEIQEARIPELSEVDGEVRADLTEAKQVELAKAALAGGRERLLAGTSLDELAAELGVEVEESAEFGRGEPIGSLGANRAVATAALELDPGAFGGPIGETQGAVLFEVVERKRFDAAEFEANKESTRSQLVAERASEVLTSLIAARREEMGVEYDPSFIENFQLSQS
jgi:peptidyl-prolyl cis-trans isomerase D